MQAETEKLLATLEMLSQYGGYTPIHWDTQDWGEFNLWNLLNSERYVKETDLELVLEHWQNMESWGTPTDMSTDDYEYAPTRSERKQTDWDIEIASDRSSIYREIELFLTSNCSSIQGYKIAHNETNLEWSHPDFYISSIVAKNNNDEWLCLIPRVPDQASIYGRKRGDKEFVTPDRSETNLSLSNELTTILDRLKPLQMYGYYHGGYNYTYSHQIYCGISSTKETAIELALQFANMVTIARPTDAYRHDGYNSDRISQFMNECLRDRTRYSVSFWDLAYTYELGKTPDGDWIGVRSFIEFEYNP